MNKSVLMALGLSVVLVLWLLSGGSSEPVAEQTQTGESVKVALMKVETKTSRAQMTSKNIVLQGQVEPFRVLSLKAEVDGVVEVLPVEIGQRLAKGELLMRQALKYRLAQKAQAKAQIEHRKSLVAASKKLQQQNLASATKVAEDLALLAQAEAQLAAIEFEIDKINIVAPFAGVMNERLVEIGDFVDKGQPVATMVDDTKLRISAMVGQHYLDQLALGQSVAVELVNGETVQGALSFISTTAHDATRSYRVEVLVENPQLRRWVGMSATLNIGISQVEGHWVKTSVVGLSSSGQLQVKTVDDQSRVKTYPIEIITTKPDGLWISGLPTQVELITLGQDFVSAEQQVIGQHYDGES